MLNCLHYGYFAREDWGKYHNVVVLRENYTL